MITFYVGFYHYEEDSAGLFSFVSIILHLAVN